MGRPAGRRYGRGLSSSPHPFPHSIHICDRPADRDGEPDASDAEEGEGGEGIGKNDAASEGEDGQDDAHTGLFDGAIVGIQHGEDTDADVAGPFDTEVACADRDGFCRGLGDEEGHQLGGEGIDDDAREESERDDHLRRGDDALSDALLISGAIVLRDGCREGIPEVHEGGVGQGVDLDAGSEGSHDDGAEAVHKALHEKDTEIHDGLLEAGQKRESGDVAEDGWVPAAVFLFYQKVFSIEKAVAKDTETRSVLSDDGRLGRAGDALLEDQDEEKVEHDIQEGGDDEEDERDE